MTLVPTKIIKLPWEAKASGRTRETVKASDVGKLETVAAPAAAASAAALNDDIKKLVADAIKSFMGGNKSVSAVETRKAIFPKLKVPAGIKKAALDLVGDVEFLDSIQLILDGDTIENPSA